MKKYWVVLFSLLLAAVLILSFVPAEAAIGDGKTVEELIEEYAELHPEFLTSFDPLPDDESAPSIVREMLRAGQACGVGPMAAVAGAIAEHIARELNEDFTEVIVENGGFGSQSAVPIGKRILEAAFGLDGSIPPVNTSAAASTVADPDAKKGT